MTVRKKITPILESILLLMMIWLFSYHYDPYSSIPVFNWSNTFLDFYRVMVDVLIGVGLILRVSRLIKRRFNPIEGKVAKLDLAIFMGYTILILPDVWLFIKWYYFANTYGWAILMLLSPWLFWFMELYASISNRSKQTRLKWVGITILGIFMVIGLTWTYLYTVKQEIEKETIE